MQVWTDAYYLSTLSALHLNMCGSNCLNNICNSCMVIDLVFPGKYSITATNSAGKRQIAIKVVVVGKPGPPNGQLQVSDTTAENARLTWTAPKDNGGSEITNYVVHKRDASNGMWALVTSSVTSTSCVIPGLIDGNEYAFRVMAENRFGISSPVMSQTIVAKYPFSKFNSFICDSILLP